jgi:membrane protein YdbS with pleckstrin-like domain
MQADPSQTDLAWRGYSGWAMLPGFVVCGVISALLLTSTWFFDEARGVVAQIGSLAVFGIVWAIWIFQIFRWFYRGATYVYRLTPRFLFVERGFLYNPTPAIDLFRVGVVKWSAGWLGRFFGVGSVTLEGEGGAEFTMTGIRRPAAFAEEIEAAVKRVKTSSLSPTS